MAVVTDFIQSPTLDKLLKLKKEDLLAVGNELNMDVKRSMRKAQIVRSIAKDLIECEDYPEDFNESAWEKLPADPREIESDKVKLARIEAEKAMFVAESKERAEVEKAKIEAETRRMELQFRRDSDENRRNEFDVTRYVKLVPQFNESDVDKYFQHFEKKKLKICIGLKMYGLHYFSLHLKVKLRKHLQLYLLMTLLIMML